jgi:four helix bundle protein
MFSYSFEDLEVYKAAREFRKKIFDLVKQLPAEEKYNLGSQMRRAATSLTNSIAEGHGRFHYQENIQYLRQSRGSLEELPDDLNICFDEAYFQATDLNPIKAEGSELLHRINGCIAYLRRRKSDEEST